MVTFEIRFVRPASAESAGTLLWRTQPGLVYQVETSADLAPESWAPVGAPIPGDGPDASVVLPAPDHASVRTYRVLARHAFR